MAYKKSKKKPMSVGGVIFAVVAAIVITLSVAYVGWAVIGAAVGGDFSGDMKSADGWLLPYNYFKDLVA